MNGNRFDLHQLGQQLWYDVVSRQMLEPVRSGANPSDGRDSLHHRAVLSRASHESLERPSPPASAPPPATTLPPGGEGRAFTRAILDLQLEADRVRPLQEASDGRHGWLSLNVSALLANDALVAIDAIRHLTQRVARPNLLAEVPATTTGLIVLEQAVFLGIPVHTTLLFAKEHCTAVARAYLRGIERRLAAGQNPAVPCVASLVIRQPHNPAVGNSDDLLHYRLGIAIALRSTRTWHTMFTGSRWQQLVQAGASAPHLLWDDNAEGQHAASLLVEVCNATGHLNGVPLSTLLNAPALPGRADACENEPGESATTPDQDWAEIIDRAAQHAELERRQVLACSLFWSDLLLKSRQSILLRALPQAITVKPSRIRYSRYRTLQRSSLVCGRRPLAACSAISASTASGGLHAQHHCR